MNNKIKLKSIIWFILGTFILALNYNVFLVSNNLVFGGVSGLAIVINKLSNFPPWLFTLIANVILLVLSFILLGKKKSIKTIAGSILYPLFISLTASWTNIIKLTPDNTFIILVFACIIYGLSNGMIYKSGFTTGGSDILVQILNKYWKISLGKASTFINGIVIIIGAFVFGITKMLYAFIAIYFSEKLMDRLVLGVSNAKMILYRSKLHDEINTIIKEKLGIGVTKIISRNAKMSHYEKNYMIITASNEIENIKKIILDIDPESFIIINDCYETWNGTKNFESCEIDM